MLVSDGASPGLLPPALSKIQYLDYRTQDRAGVIRLSRALQAITAAPPLPHPLPDPPAVPLSYLGTLAEQIDAAAILSAADQSRLVLDLKRQLRDPASRGDARTLLASPREDLLATVAQEIDELLSGSAQQATGDRVGGRSAARRGAAQAGGWSFPHPGRRRLIAAGSAALAAALLLLLGQTRERHGSLQPGPQAPPARGWQGGQGRLPQGR